MAICQEYLEKKCIISNHYRVTYIISCLKVEHGGTLCMVMWLRSCIQVGRQVFICKYSNNFYSNDGKMQESCFVIENVTGYLKNCSTKDMLVLNL